MRTLHNQIFPTNTAPNTDTHPSSRPGPKADDDVKHNVSAWCATASVVTHDRDHDDVKSVFSYHHHNIGKISGSICLPAPMALSSSEPIIDLDDAMPAAGEDNFMDMMLDLMPDCGEKENHQI